MVSAYLSVYVLFASETKKKKICYKYLILGSTFNDTSLIAQLVKNPPAMQETPVQFLGQEDLLKKG